MGAVLFESRKFDSDSDSAPSFPTGCNPALYFLVFLNISEKHEVHIIMVVASKMGDCHIDLYWIDLQLCHEDEHIHCNLEGNFEEKEFLPNQGF